jgi:hypothetical protein
MNDDDYLWDRSGPPDPLIAALEARLAPLALPAHARAPSRARPRRWPVLAASTAVAIAAAAAVVLWPRAMPAPAPTISEGAPPAGAWSLRITAGVPRIVGRAAPPTPSYLAPGEVLETGAAEVELDVPDTGVVEVAPGARVALVARGKGARLELHHGTIHARIWAPPGTFFVTTPAGTAVDLGCSYTVSIDERGAGQLSVHTGWVGFTHANQDSFVPAGAACSLRSGRAPGTPHRSDAPGKLVSALAAFDDPDGFAERTRALEAVLTEARAADAVTLWHLVVRAPEPERARVLRRLRALVPATRTVEPTAVLAGDRAALDALWDRLELGPMTLWRTWQTRALE